MAELKTKPNKADVKQFLDSIEDDQKRNDSYTLLAIFQEITGEKPKMWGESIVGFGSYHYKYDSGREGDWFITGFSPRKTSLTLYIMAGFDNYEKLLDKLGKHKTGKSCLYIKKLSDIDMEVLKEMISSSYHYMSEKHRNN